MKLRKMLVMVVVIGLMDISAAMVAAAGDFDWTRDFNARAQNDPPRFRESLVDRFRLRDAQITMVLRSAGSPADAYLMLRLGEMSGMPMDHVIEKYRSDRGRGWGALAKSLGIKPGSEEFHALKRGSDVRGFDAMGRHKGGGVVHLYEDGDGGRHKSGHGIDRHDDQNPGKHGGKGKGKDKGWW